ncbi:unnamed protein product, partial [Ectocarpus sp. 12 AP-2014]
SGLRWWSQESTRSPYFDGNALFTNCLFSVGRGATQQYPAVVTKHEKEENIQSNDKHDNIQTARNKIHAVHPLTSTHHTTGTARASTLVNKVNYCATTGRATY